MGKDGRWSGHRSHAHDNQMYHDSQEVTRKKKAQNFGTIFISSGPPPSLLFYLNMKRRSGAPAPTATVAPGWRS
jgi:hypothetical protein